LFHDVVQFSHQQILSLFARQFPARYALLAHIEGIWAVAQHHQMPLQLERGQQIVEPS